MRLQREQQRKEQRLRKRSKLISGQRKMSSRNSSWRVILTCSNWTKMRLRREPGLRLKLLRKENLLKKIIKRS
jgi:hypothetical protein